MVIKGIEKVAKLVYEESPAEHHARTVAKNKYIGALLGTYGAGLAAGLKKKSLKAAIIAAPVGAVAGGALFNAAGNVYKNYKTNQDYKKSYNMRITPRPLSHED